jgi:serine/threonine protein kinase
MASIDTSACVEADFGQLRLLARLGTDGECELFLARARSGRPVVVRRIAAHLACDPDAIARFVAAARTAARFDHPNVRRLLELGQIDGRHYVALEYLDGVTFADLMAAAATHPQLAALDLIAAVIAQVADALDHVHLR